MLNIVLALRCLAKFWAHRVILVHCNNMAVVQVVQLGKSRYDFLSACVRNIWLLVASFDIDLQITHIQGSSNIIADTLSRLHSGAPAIPSILQAIKDNCAWDLIPPRFLIQTYLYESRCFKSFHFSHIFGLAKNEACLQTFNHFGLQDSCLSLFCFSSCYGFAFYYYPSQCYGVY